MGNYLKDLPLFAPLPEPVEPKQKKSKPKPKPATVEVPAKSDEVTVATVIAYYRVNCTRDGHNRSGLSKAYEDAIEHLCLTYGNLVALEAIKQAILNNKQTGRPSMNFITAIAKRIYEEDEQSRVRRDAINRAVPMDGEFVPSEDAYDKLRREFVSNE